MHKSRWIHYADLRRSLQQCEGTRGWSPRRLVFAQSHRALSAPFLVRRSIPLRLPTGTTPPRPALLGTRKSAGRQTQSVRGMHLAG
jgi:hypothetical protein